MNGTRNCLDFWFCLCFVRTRNHLACSDLPCSECIFPCDKVAELCKKRPTDLTSFQKYLYLLLKRLLFRSRLIHNFLPRKAALRAKSVTNREKTLPETEPIELSPRYWRFQVECSVRRGRAYVQANMLNQVFAIIEQGSGVLQLTNLVDTPAPLNKISTDRYYLTTLAGCAETKRHSPTKSVNVINEKYSCH